MRALLDVNVLLALLDSDHVDHVRAWEWLTAEIGAGWASCPLTENGFVRIISQPRYPNPIATAQALELLARATATEHHEFWPADISILDGDVVLAQRVHGPKQVTDLYLLALAVARGGRLVTFDSAVPQSAVPGARPEHLVVL